MFYYFLNIFAAQINQLNLKAMKKILFLLAAVAAFAFAGCEKEEENENGGGNVSIVGIWNIAGQKYFQFNEDGSGQMFAGIGDETGYVDIRWTLSGMKLTVSIQNLIEEDRPSGTFVYDVVTLTSTNLALKLIIEGESVTMRFTKG